MPNWYYYDKTGKHGPIPSLRLKYLADTGQITPETTIETEKGRQARAKNVAGLFRVNRWFYYESSGKKVGPLSDDDLKFLANTSTITPGTILELENVGKRAACNVHGLFRSKATEPTTKPPLPLPSPPVSAKSGVGQIIHNISSFILNKKPWSPADPASTLWQYYDAANQKVGPFMWREMQSLARSGVIHPKTVITSRDTPRQLAGHFTGEGGLFPSKSEVEKFIRDILHSLKGFRVHSPFASVAPSPKIFVVKPSLSQLPRTFNFKLLPESVTTVDCLSKYSDDVIFHQPEIFSRMENMLPDDQGIAEHLQNLSLPTVKDITNYVIHNIPNITEHFESLSLPTVEDITDYFIHDIPNIIEHFQRLSQPVIADVMDLLLRHLVGKIHDIPVKLTSKIDGKSYGDESKENSPGREKGQASAVQRPKSGQGKQQKTKEDAKSAFDLFDLIFLHLQPPLGETFNDTIAFPSPLYPFQVEGVKFLADRTAVLLGDEMGLGKTVQVITACRLLFRQNKVSSACVICPKAVLTNWERELWKWAPELRVVKLAGGKQERENLWKSDAHVYICTYETLRIDSELVYRYRKTAKKSETHFDLMILDEIQKTKSPKAKSTTAVRDIAANYRWGMSGTPLENGIDDLKTICVTLQPDIFANVRPTDSADWNMKQVIEAYQPIFLRRRAEQVLKDMPEKVTVVIPLELSEEQQKKYDLAEQEGIVMLEKLGETATVQHVIALIQKLKLICNYETESKKSAKLDYLKDELEELVAAGNKALVFSQYPNETLKKIQPELTAFQPGIYDGKLTDSARSRMVDDFQNREDSKVMLLSSKAGNAGITLTRANYVFHFDMWWNPAVSDQAVGRARRIGQKAKTVFEYFLLMRGTIEERIYQIVEGKRELFNRMVDDLSVGDDMAATKILSHDEIFGLFDLKSPQKTSKKPASALMDSFDPFDFEKAVAVLFGRMGYHVKLTKQTRDGGVDFYAKYPTPTGKYEEAIIQCKHRENPNATVGVEAVREIFGVLRSSNQFIKAYLVTNARFSSDAIDFARNSNVELISGIELEFLVRQRK